MQSRGLKNVDIFVIANAVLLLFMCVFVYYSRFVEYRGAANIHEFFFYAVVIFAAIFAGWLYFRHLQITTSLLLLLQVGILMHFAGAYIPVNEGRLYDAHFLYIRYDNYVHFVNAFAVAALVTYLFTYLNVNIPTLNNLVVILVVMGLGALVEIVEYIVVLTVEDHGVGGYHNNMQDLIANLAGSVFFIALKCYMKKPMVYVGLCPARAYS